MPKLDIPLKQFDSKTGTVTGSFESKLMNSLGDTLYTETGSASATGDQAGMRVESILLLTALNLLTNYTFSVLFIGMVGPPKPYLNLSNKKTMINKKTNKAIKSSGCSPSRICYNSSNNNNGCCTWCGDKSYSDTSTNTSYFLTNFYIMKILTNQTEYTYILCIYVASYTDNTSGYTTNYNYICINQSS